MKRVLVTGGAGFISSNVIRHLLANTGHEVISLDASLVTQAGTFTRCAVVRNEQPLAKGKFVTEWTWAPGVGLAQIVTSTIDPQGVQHEQTKLQLVAYSVK